MIIQNFNFFDKFGKNLNLDWNTTTEIWEGVIYFPELSTYLYDNENIFILEKIGTDYKFPALSSGDTLHFEWEMNTNADNLFLYDVEKDYELNNFFIARKESQSISYNDIYVQPNDSNVDISLPLQINIAFNPFEEINYTRKLIISTVNDANPEIKTKIAEIGFYGEGLNEDERFGTWARNFGIKFNKEDANILKEYDVKEAFPDYKQLNLARKNLLVNKEHVFPYIGTYKGLANFVNLMGYKDVLQVKEYWRNINEKSPYFNKQTLVDISDYLDDGKIDNMNILDKNKNIKHGKQFRKTECLALVYQFTRESGDYDDDGIPIVEETTDFTVDEMFYKLNKLSDKLKAEIIPVNVKIKDIIGEFIYFQKITIKFWKDENPTVDINLNERSEVLCYPDENVNLVLRSLAPLYRKDYDNGSDFAEVIFNNGTKDPFEANQKYKINDIPQIVEYIEEFYNEIKEQRYPDLGARLSWEDGDDRERIIGAPIVLDIDTGKFTFETFKGVTFEDLAGMGGNQPLYTLENLDFRNNYEITWKIQKSGGTPYNFEYRGKIENIHKLPHFLPYAGEYRIIAELHDFYGTTSVFSKFMTVQDDMKPDIVGVARLEDKFNYTVGNLDNVRLIDFGATYDYYPRTTVLDNEDAVTRIDVYKQLLEWTRYYQNNYGSGQNLYDVELYDTAIGDYVEYNDPSQNHPKLSYWGLGGGTVPTTVGDMSDVTIGSLYHQRLGNMAYLDDFLAGFYINDPQVGDEIHMSLFSTYTIPAFTTLDELVDILNASSHPGIKLFNFEIINGDPGMNQFIIHAQAEYFGKEMYHILESIPANMPGTPKLDKYSFYLPKHVHSQRVIDNMNNAHPLFDEETLFLTAKTSDMINGNVQDPNFWVNNKFWKFENDEQFGFLPTIFDENAFNIKDIKIFDSSFSIPENCPVFFNVNNLDGKKDYIWTLTDVDTDEEIVRTRNVPFFVWKFKDIGVFRLKVEVTDNRGTVYSNEMDRMITVLDKNEYVKHIETRLNRRKNQLLNKIN